MFLPLDHLLLLSVIFGDELLLHSPSGLTSDVEQYNGNHNESKQHSHPCDNIALQSSPLNPKQEPDHDSEHSADGEDEYESSNRDLLAVEWIVIFGNSCEMGFVGTDSPGISVGVKLLCRVVIVIRSVFLMAHVGCFDGDLNKLLSLCMEYVYK